MLTKALLIIHSILHRNIRCKPIKKIFIRLLRVIYNTLVSFFYGAYIPQKANLGKNIIFPHHLYGIFISKGTVIGDNCTIHQHVTIGSTKDPKLSTGEGIRHSPKIGNNVYIGANVCIIGNCEIGENCIIGAGTTIANAIIPANSIVVGSKFRIINENKNKNG